jgi:trimeric autotransporter adhesin
MGIGGGTLMNGWRGRILKEWTVVSTIAAGTGLPQTPIYPASVPGTGFAPGSIRPDYTGAPIYAGPRGFHLNSAAYTAPLPGQWGNAGRNSITGPNQFSLNASLGRTFRLHDKFNLDVRVDSTNLLNHPVFSSWVTTINNAQFGLPAAANPMRSMQTTIRLRY